MIITSIDAGFVALGIVVMDVIRHGVVYAVIGIVFMSDIN
jgi:hypothetical protein